MWGGGVNNDIYLRFISKAWNAITKSSAEHVWGPLSTLLLKRKHGPERNSVWGVRDWLALTLSMGFSFPDLFTMETTTWRCVYGS